MYIANVENSEIDVSGIRTILVQGDSAYPSIRFVLDPSLTGLSWRVRGTYLSSNIAVTSPELVATETASSVALDWSVASDFTTYSGEMQLSLVGSNELGTVITKALGEITIQKDYSLGEHQNITLDLFEQLMAQANAAISKYPTIIDGNWYVWNVTVGEYQDTGVAASSQWKSGTGITGTSTTPTAFPSSGITTSNVGDMYLNSSAGYTYRCTLSGAAAVALWVYVSNITGPQGIPGTNGTNGVGVPVGGTARQALIKLSATDYDTGWSDNLLQYATMPTASSDNLGQIAQFTGTTGTYTHGHIYECVSSGGGSPTYSWSEIVYGDPNSVSYSAQPGKIEADKAQARTNIDAADTITISVISNSGVISGGVVSAQGTPNQTVAVSSGSVVTPEGERYSFDSISALSATSADATNPRIDIVYVTDAGAVTYLAGTAAGSPAQPATPTNGTILAAITRAANDNTIATEDIKDKRYILRKPLASTLLWTNPSPTSNFAAQKVTIDLTEYSFILVLTYLATSVQNTANSLFVMKGNTGQIIACTVTNKYRVISVVEDTGVTFGGGVNVTAYGSTSAADDSLLIPYKIFGIKNLA